MIPASVSSFLGSVGDVLWPLIAAGVLVFLLPVFRKVIESRGFSIEVLGMKLSAQAASDQLARQIEDLQARVIELEATSAGAPSGPPGHERRVELADTGVDTQPASAPQSESSLQRRVLWVDDNPENNAYEMHALTERGWQVAVARDTDGGLRRFRDSGPFDAVISDVARDERGGFDPDAGLKLLKAIRSVDEAIPFLIYTSSQTSLARGSELTDAGATSITASPMQLQSILAASTAFAFEQRLDRLLRSCGFEPHAQHGPARVDFAARKADRFLAIEVISNASLANLHRRLREARLRLGRAAEAEPFTDLIVVTPTPIRLGADHEGEPQVKAMSYEELKGFLRAIS